MANNFLPFAAAPGANVLTNAQYAALTALPTGFVAGTAQSVALNKVWRQSSIMAAVIGQVISDLSGSDAVEDGTTATLVTQLKTVIKASTSAPVGSALNVKASNVNDAATMTFTADEIMIKAALGGQAAILTAFNKTINVNTVGLNGMGVGLAPISGSVAIYAIYNPTTGVSGLLGVDNASAISPEVYTGPNAPAGFTMSALIACVMTTAGRLVRACSIINRACNFMYITVVSSVSAVISFTAVNCAVAVPPNARKVGGFITVNAVSANNASTNVASNPQGQGWMQTAGSLTSGGNIFGSPFSGLLLLTPQTLWWQTNVVSGTSSGGVVYISSYEI